MSKPRIRIMFNNPGEDITGCKDSNIYGELAGGITNFHLLPIDYKSGWLKQYNDEMGCIIWFYTNCIPIHIRYIQ